MSRSLGARAKAALVVTLAAAAVVVLPAAPASAALTATLSDLTLPAVPYSFESRTVSGQVTLTASDTADGLLDPRTGLIATPDGWHVTLVAGPLLYTGQYGGASILAANLAITALQAPVAQEGSQDVNLEDGGPRIPTTTVLPAPLDTQRTVLQADADNGIGTYTQGIELSLIVPGGARAGTYTSTITTTISSGP